MRRLQTLSIVATLALLTHCAPPPPPPPAPAPPPPALPAFPPMAGDWRDLPLTQGGWSYQNGVATFADVLTSGSPSFSMTCDRPKKIIRFLTEPVQVPVTGMKITTTFGFRSLPASASGGHDGEITSELSALDSFLDSLAFSRGRFLVELPKDRRLILPIQPEVARVIEVCRE